MAPAGVSYLEPAFACQHTSSITHGARIALGALLAAAALAHVADNVLGVCELCRLALVQLLQRDFVLLLYRPALARHMAATGHATHTAHAAHAVHASEAAHAAKHLRKDVVNVGAFAAHASASGGVKGGHAVRVVQVALVIIGELSLIHI